MKRALMKERIEERRFQARIVYIYYLLIIASGIVILFLGSRLGSLVDVIAAAFYVGVTAIFYALTKAT